METALSQKERTIMNKSKWVTIAMSIMLLVSPFSLASHGIARAALASQEWAGVGGTFLGNPSGGGSYINHIHNVEAPNACLDVPGSSFYTFNGVSDATSIGAASPNALQEQAPIGAQVQLFDCEPQDVAHDFGRNQIWNQQDNGDGTWSYFVTGNFLPADDGTNNGTSTDYCLDSLGIQNTAGSPVEVETCNGANSQRWNIGPDGELQSVDSAGYCLDINQATFGSDGNGAKVVLEPCAG
jgi:hypothetical protein